MTNNKRLRVWCTLRFKLMFAFSFKKFTNLVIKNSYPSYRWKYYDKSLIGLLLENICYYEKL